MGDLDQWVCLLNQWHFSRTNKNMNTIRPSYTRDDTSPHREHKSIEKRTRSTYRFILILRSKRESVRSALVTEVKATVRAHTMPVKTGKPSSTEMTRVGKNTFIRSIHILCQHCQPGDDHEDVLLRWTGSRNSTFNRTIKEGSFWSLNSCTILFHSLMMSVSSCTLTRFGRTQRWRPGNQWRCCDII